MEKCSNQSHRRDLTRILQTLARSKFRSRFSLDAKDKEYIRRVGMEKIRGYAYDFIEQRLAPAQPKNDGKQALFRGHPVFKAQHATATCCHGCLSKWHHIPKGRPLSREEIDFVVSLIMEWIARQASVNTNTSPF